MRDQFVWGLKNKSAAETVIKRKRFHIISAGMNESTKKAEQMSINVIRDKNRCRNGCSGSSEKQTGKSFQCMRCGKNNLSPVTCKYKAYKCNSCGNVGHLSGMCKTKIFNSGQEKTNNGKPMKQNFNKQNFLEESESLVDDFERLFKLEDIVKVNGIKPFETKLKLNGNIVNFDIDTGSPETRYIV
ncbi:uncharacterized protein LOC122508766 [Leptopilina heterotoma]|uniref:uncharacterized protein LOC122508766 n=1 Tax=Leptopilina heterotoma TaxID=63436 RepID=UPI001CA97BB7|nr:uncharacterized protein LOC122508766 [Leptopilina heterotoma]